MSRTHKHELNIFFTLIAFFDKLHFWCKLVCFNFCLMIYSFIYQLPLHPCKHLSWYRRPQDVFKTSFVFLFRRRLKEQDEYIRFSHTSSEDGLVKTILFVLVIILQDVLLIHLQDVFKTSSRHHGKASSRHVEDICQKFWRVFKTLQDIFKTSCKDLFKTFSRGIIKFNCSCKHIVETYSTRFWDVLERRLSTEGFA